MAFFFTMKNICIALILSLAVPIVGLPGLLAQDPPLPVTVINKGIGGQTAANGRSRFERDVISLHPQHLVLFFGINDACNRNVPLADYEKTLTEMIGRAKDAGITSIVLVTPHPVIAEFVAERHPDHPALPNLGDHLATYAATVRKVADANHVPVADFEAAVIARGGATKDASSLIRNEANTRSRDGIHLTPEGYELLAEVVASSLAGKVKPGETVLCLGDSLTQGAHVKGAGTSEGETYPARLKKRLNP